MLRLTCSISKDERSWIYLYHSISASVHVPFSYRRSFNHLSHYNLNCGPVKFWHHSREIQRQSYLKSKPTTDLVLKDNCISFVAFWSVVGGLWEHTSCCCNDCFKGSETQRQPQTRGFLNWPPTALFVACRQKQGRQSYSPSSIHKYILFLVSDMHKTPVLRILRWAARVVTPE